jgi:hypothetical protein
LFMPSKSAMSARNTSARSTCWRSLATSASSLSISASTCRVCPVMSWLVSSGIWPER